jgi:hypothetical protein
VSVLGWSIPPLALAFAAVAAAAMLALLLRPPRQAPVSAPAPAMRRRVTVEEAVSYLMSRVRWGASSQPEKQRAEARARALLAEAAASGKIGVHVVTEAERELGLLTPDMAAVAVVEGESPVITDQLQARDPLEDVTVEPTEVRIDALQMKLLWPPKSDERDDAARPGGP